MPVSWLDTVVALPLIGIRLAKNWKRCLRYPELIAPIVDDLEASGEPHSVEITAPGSLKLDLGNGAIVKMTPHDVVVEFVYQQTAARKPGRIAPDVTPPVARPYSDLLALLKGTADRVVSSLSVDAPLETSRVGVVALCRLAPEHLPPGAQALIDHEDSRWREPLRKLDISLLAELSRTAATLDQCHHRLNLDRTVEFQEVSLVLDWQRVFTAEAMTVTSETLTTCTSAAAAYFQGTGEDVGDAS